MISKPAAKPEEIIAHTEAWLLEAVIGLNLCPFAKSVQVKKQIAYQVSNATDTASLLADLAAAMALLDESEPEMIETLLLIHPSAMRHFLDYNDFLSLADALLEDAGLTGVFQIASFHPDYQFAGTAPDDITNCSNRSPYPMLHLLREDSVEKAVSAMPEAELIVERNLATLRQLGTQGWQELQERIRPS